MQATTDIAGIRQSESIANLAAALAKTQGELSFAQKNAVNPHLKNRYADLSSVWEACRAPLTKNGLAVAQFPGRIENGTMSLVTRLMHASGEWIESVASAPVTKADPQGVGSCLTYLRRYSLAAVVGIYQDDDDGNAAARPSSASRSTGNGNGANGASNGNGASAEPVQISDDQLEAIARLSERLGYDGDRIMAGCRWASGGNALSPAQLTADQGQKMIGHLEKQAEKAAVNAL